MKTLVVAEKPSVGRDIARVLGVTGRGTGCLTGKDYTVTWAVGHLVSLKEPGEVDERYRKWSMACLPMLPEKIPLKVLPATKDQFEVVKKLMNDAETEKIVCATDSGREGELIFRYIYEMAGCKKPVMRLWISSMTDAAIRAGFATMKPGSEYNALYLSGALPLGGRLAGRHERVARVFAQIQRAPVHRPRADAHAGADREARPRDRDLCAGRLLGADGGLRRLQGCVDRSGEEGHAHSLQGTG